MKKADKRPLIAVVGDGSLEAGDERLALAEELGTRLVEHQYRVLTGGLGGVMEAACRGAHRAACYRDGDTVGLLPGTDIQTRNAYVDIAIPTALGHVRNALCAQSVAVIAVGGGAGTLSELALAWVYNRLIIALKTTGWSGRLADQRIDERLRFPTIPDDRVYAAADPAQAIETLNRWLPFYGSGQRDDEGR